MWTDPIFDRTEEDVLSKTPKGYCNVSDLQRLEDNTEHLANIFGVGITTKSWNITDFPTVAELARIRENAASVRSAYYTRPSTPGMPDNPLADWEKWNDIEQILFDLCALYTLNLEAGNYTGESFAGDMIGVI